MAVFSLLHFFFKVGSIYHVYDIFTILISIYHFKSIRIRILLHEQIKSVILHRSCRRIVRRRGISALQEQVPVQTSNVGSPRYCCDNRTILDLNIQKHSSCKHDSNLALHKWHRFCNFVWSLQNGCLHIQI
jgi:hypothetical protein